MDGSLTKLLSAESDLLVALENGAPMVASYNQTWSQLLDVFDTASKTGGVCRETLSLVHTIASRILKIADCCMLVKRTEQNSTTQLRADYDTMIQQMEALDINAHPDSSHSDSSPDAGPSVLPALASDAGRGTSPPFLATAYRWLLDNLHNPYPTADVKKSLAVSSSCQVSSVNSWFTNTRRRIGWTTLCRERFSNCRADMLDAAYCALVEEDPQHILSDEIRHSFVMIKAEAENLYSSAFARSTFTEHLDAIAKEITSSGARIASHTRQMDPIKMARDSYPSPDRSATGTPAPVLGNLPTEEIREANVAPQLTMGLKRRRSSIEPVDQSSPGSRPIKRLRVSGTPPCLPSPPASTDGTNISSTDGPPELPLVQPVQPETSVVSPSRLSDANANYSSNRPHGTMAASYPHIGFDPQSCSNMNTEDSIDDWFNTNFETLFAIPPPVEAAQLDSSTLWDVELFRDYSIPGNSKHLPDYASPPIDSHISVPADFSNLDHLLQSIGEHTFTSPSETMAPSDVPVLSYSACSDSSIPDASQINTDWASLLNESHQPSIYPAFPQYTIDSQPLPDLDLSMLQLPPVIPTSSCQTDIASKRAKLQQFHAMQEAVRRMERELQSEGVIA